MEHGLFTPQLPGVHQTHTHTHTARAARDRRSATRREPRERRDPRPGCIGASRGLDKGGLCISVCSVLQRPERVWSQAREPIDRV